ncbi:TfoX family protein [Candidatus Parcubacteria bacterium]|nr:MAG: TfoX family protein [Candidatus Parcubacteria bacterium]
MSSKDFHDYIIKDVFLDIPGITSKRMFGGYGLYKDGIFFAIISDDAIYFKVGPNNQADFEKKGSKPFTYAKKDGKQVVMSFWEFPPDVMEDKEELKDWVEKSVEAARNK